MLRDTVCGVILNEKTAKFPYAPLGRNILLLQLEMQKTIQEEQRQIRQVIQLLQIQGIWTLTGMLPSHISASFCDC
jgi:hypothetical protein